MTTQTELTHRDYVRIKTNISQYNPSHHKDSIGISPIQIRSKYEATGISQKDFKKHENIYGPEYIDIKVPAPRTYQQGFSLKQTYTYRSDNKRIHWFNVAELVDKSKYLEADGWKYHPEDRTDEMLALCDKTHYGTDDEVELINKLYSCLNSVALNTNTLASELEKRIKLKTFKEGSSQSKSAISQARTDLRTASNILSTSYEASIRKNGFEKLLKLIIQRDGYFTRRKLSYHNAYVFVSKAEALNDEIFDRDLPLPKKIEILNKVIELLTSDRNKERNQWNDMCAFTPDTSDRYFKKNDEIWDYAYITGRVDYAASLLTSETNE